jgi:putative transposase
MLVYEYPLDAAPAQHACMDEAIRVAHCVRKKSRRQWMDVPGTTANDLHVQCRQLAHAFSVVAQLNSQARQAAADRAWQAISRFCARCRAKTPGKKGYPCFQHDTAARSTRARAGSWSPTDGT